MKSLKYFGIILADVLITFCAFWMLQYFIVTLLPHEMSNQHKSDIALGNVCAEIDWDDNQNIDLDLWGKSPGDEWAVGYSDLHGANLSLYKDTLGWEFNPLHRNMEIMCGAEALPGEWTFNVSYFSDHDNLKRLAKVTMILTIKKSNGDLKIISPVEYTLKEGQEKTMFNFRLDDSGELIEDSVNSMDHPLRHPLKHEAPKL